MKKLITITGITALVTAIVGFFIRHKKEKA